jgi:3-oxoacyl-[acyl-carrier protein] reductase
VTPAPVLAGRIAIVTGAASGIGRAIATAFAGAGASVVLADIDDAGGRRTAEALADRGVDATFARVDVGSRQQVDDLVADTVRSAGGLDIMANIAGAPGRRVQGRLPLLEVTEDDFFGSVRTNVYSALIGSQAAAKVMQERGGGVILNTASTAIDTNGAGVGLYTMTKAAVAMLSKTLAAELGPHGIRVNALAPGLTPTSWFDEHFDGEQPTSTREQFFQAMADATPLRRIASPDDTARLAVFLASDDASFVSGQIVRTNGGLTTPW